MSAEFMLRQCSVVVRIAFALIEKAWLKMRKNSPLVGWLIRLSPWILKLLISGILVWYLLGKIGSNNVIERATGLSPLSFVGAFALISLQGVLAGMRWSLIVMALGLRLDAVKAITISFVSLFFNQFLPASVGGDLVRVWQSNKVGLPVNTAITSVMLERFASLLAVVSLSLALLPVIVRYPGGASIQGGAYIIAIAGALSLGMLIFLDRLPAPWHRWRLVRGVAKLSRDTRALFLRPRYALPVILTVLAGQAILAGAVFLLAIGLKIQVGFLECLILMPPVVLISSLPISVGGWGVRELAMVGAFGIVGVPPESAITLSIVLGLTGTSVSLTGGLLWAIERSPRAERGRLNKIGQ